MPRKENATMEDAMETVQTVLRIMATAMADGTMGMIISTVVSLAVTMVADRWIKECIDVWQKEKRSHANLRCNAEAKENMVGWDNSCPHNEVRAEETEGGNTQAKSRHCSFG